MDGATTGLAEPGPAAGAPPLLQQHPITPRGVTMRSTAEQLTIEWRWFSPVETLLMVAFTVFWFSRMPHGILGKRDAFFVPTDLVFVAAGLLLVYATVALLVNRTTLTIGRSWVRVRSRPLPWFSNVDVPSAGIRKLYCGKKTTTGTADKSARTRYELAALMRDGARRRIVTASSPDLPQFVGHHAEAWLKLTHPEAAGELPPH